MLKQTLQPIKKQEINSFKLIECIFTFYNYKLEDFEKKLVVLKTALTKIYIIYSKKHIKDL